MSLSGIKPIALGKDFEPLHESGLMFSAVFTPLYFTFELCYFDEALNVNFFYYVSRSKRDNPYFQLGIKKTRVNIENDKIFY